MEKINEASKLIAQTIIELELLTAFEWVDGSDAANEIQPLIDKLKQALEALVTN